MIIEKIRKISNIQEFIEENKENEIVLVHHTSIDIPLALRIVKECEKIDTFLSIIIGENYFYITQCTSKSTFGCHYMLTDKKLEEFISEKVK